MKVCRSVPKNRLVDPECDAFHACSRRGGMSTTTTKSVLSKHAEVRATASVTGDARRATILTSFRKNARAHKQCDFLLFSKDDMVGLLGVGHFSLKIFLKVPHFSKGGPLLIGLTNSNGFMTLCTRCAKNGTNSGFSLKQARADHSGTRVVHQPKGPVHERVLSSCHDGRGVWLSDTSACPRGSISLHRARTCRFCTRYQRPTVGWAFSLST